MNIRGYNRHDMKWMLGLIAWREDDTACISRKQRTLASAGVAACGPVPKLLSGHAVFSVPMVGLCEE